MRDPRDAPAPASGRRDEAVLPVVEEALRVDTRHVDVATVRLEKTVEAHEVELEVPLERRSVSIERVVVNRVVDAVEPSRREGDVTIVPVYEEVLVKRWLLKEELRIGLATSVESSGTVRAVLRRESVDVIRTPLADDDGPRLADDAIQPGSRSP